MSETDALITVLRSFPGSTARTLHTYSLNPAHVLAPCVRCDKIPVSNLPLSKTVSTLLVDETNAPRHRGC